MNDKEQQKKTPTKILTLASQYEDVFEVPKELPPLRSHDNAINLIFQAKLVSIRPYHYLYYQKDKIQKIVHDLLKSGTIQHIQKPYSSPILLVRQVNGSWRSMLTIEIQII